MLCDRHVLQIYRVEMADPGKVVLVLFWAIYSFVESIVYEES